MKQESRTDDRTGFTLDEHAKAQKLARLRQRLEMATPLTAKPVRRHYGWDARRTFMAVFLALIFVLAIVAGSGVFR